MESKILHMPLAACRLLEEGTLQMYESYHVRIAFGACGCLGPIRRIVYISGRCKYDAFKPDLFILGNGNRI